jgi:hypothetical protein
MSFTRECTSFVRKPRTGSRLANHLCLDEGLVRFTPKGDDSKILIGEPVDSSVDVGAAVRQGEEVSVLLFTGSSVTSAGQATDRVAVIGRLLSPLSAEEVGTIRCIGLNVRIPS